MQYLGENIKNYKLQEVQNYLSQNVDLYTVSINDGAYIDSYTAV